MAANRNSMGENTKSDLGPAGDPHFSNDNWMALSICTHDLI